MSRHLVQGAAVALLSLGLLSPGWGGEVLDLRVDFRHTNGAIRALHGINRGPLVAGGLIDLSDSQRALNIPSRSAGQGSDTRVRRARESFAPVAS